MSGRNSVVECYLAKVDVDGSNPFARSIFFGGIAKWLRQRSAKPLFMSSNLIAASMKINSCGIDPRSYFRFLRDYDTVYFSSFPQRYYVAIHFQVVSLFSGKSESHVVRSFSCALTGLKTRAIFI